MEPVGRSDDMGLSVPIPKRKVKIKFQLCRLKVLSLKYIFQMVLLLNLKEVETYKCNSSYPTDDYNANAVIFLANQQTGWGFSCLANDYIIFGVPRLSTEFGIGPGVILAPDGWNPRGGYSGGDTFDGKYADLIAVTRGNTTDCVVGGYTGLQPAYMHGARLILSNGEVKDLFTFNRFDVDGTAVALSFPFSKKKILKALDSCQVYKECKGATSCPFIPVSLGYNLETLTLQKSIVEHLAYCSSLNDEELKRTTIFANASASILDYYGLFKSCLSGTETSITKFLTNLSPSSYANVTTLWKIPKPTLDMNNLTLYCNPPGYLATVDNVTLAKYNLTRDCYMAKNLLGNQTYLSGLGIFSNLTKTTLAQNNLTYNCLVSSYVEKIQVCSRLNGSEIIETKILLNLSTSLLSAHNLTKDCMFGTLNQSLIYYKSNTPERTIVVNSLNETELSILNLTKNCLVKDQFQLEVKVKSMAYSEFESLKLVNASFKLYFNLTSNCLIGDYDKLLIYIKEANQTVKNNILGTLDQGTLILQNLTKNCEFANKSLALEYYKLNSSTSGRVEICSSLRDQELSTLNLTRDCLVKDEKALNGFLVNQSLENKAKIVETLGNDVLDFLDLTRNCTFKTKNESLRYFQEAQNYSQERVGVCSSLIGSELNVLNLTRPMYCFLRTPQDMENYLSSASNETFLSLGLVTEARKEFLNLTQKLAQEVCPTKWEVCTSLNLTELGLVLNMFSDSTLGSLGLSRNCFLREQPGIGLVKLGNFTALDMFGLGVIEKMNDTTLKLYGLYNDCNWLVTKVLSNETLLERSNLTRNCYEKTLESFLENVRSLGNVTLSSVGLFNENMLDLEVSKRLRVKIENLTRAELGDLHIFRVRDVEKILEGETIKCNNSILNLDAKLKEAELMNAQLLETVSELSRENKILNLTVNSLKELPIGQSTVINSVVSTSGPTQASNILELQNEELAYIKLTLGNNYNTFKTNLKDLKYCLTFGSPRKTNEVFTGIIIGVSLLAFVILLVLFVCIACRVEKAWGFPA